MVVVQVDRKSLYRKETFLWGGRWKRGCKLLCVLPNGCTFAQPLTSSHQDKMDLNAVRKVVFPSW